MFDTTCGTHSGQTIYAFRRELFQLPHPEPTPVLATRDIAVGKEWALHNLMLGVKDQIKAQYGKDSLEVQAPGLKRVSEYKTRKPKS